MAGSGEDRPIHPRELLWHYTTWTGLEGILRTKALWASQSRCLNDEMEFRYAFEIALSELRQYFLNKLSDAVSETVLGLVARLLESNRDSYAYVASFSEAYDHLAQWRAYCNPLPGFAVGFDRPALTRVVGLRRLRLEQCIYDPAAQVKLVRSALERWWNTYRVAAAGSGSSLSEDQIQHLAWNAVDELFAIAPRIKHPVFAEEREWRSIGAPPDLVQHSYEFHRSGSMIVPHVAIDLRETNGETPIRSVVVGPTPYLGTIMTTVSMLMHKHGIGIDVRRTGVPYRNW